MGHAFDTDVFVVGGGPAGLAAAIACRQQGLRVIVADSALPPIDKACGEGLMPDSLDVLARLGVSLQGYETGSFQGIRFVGPECSAEATFPVGRGLGVRRLLLHRALVQQAQSCDVEMLWGKHVSSVKDHVILVNGGAVYARWVVGADGQNSQVRDWAGLSGSRSRVRRVGLRQHFHVRSWPDFVEIFWNKHGQAYVTPIGNNEVCIALISRQRFISFEHGLAGFPALAVRLQDALPVTRLQGGLSISRRLARVHRRNMALIGEASGSVDAITGEGLAMAFRQALVLAPALAEGDLSVYGSEHRKIAKLPELMSRTMLLMDRNQWLRDRSLRAFSRQPGLFARLLALHVGELKLKDFGAGGLLDLGWQLLVA
ncbi:MAG TPA: NAD(P)/FAD-dependent oxidoreductase [Candidatus Angelobacter sp.]|nr:NAD(P)/FAD-dependent oxidoreductase [Candidatus Angelobacter sp.]